VSERVGCILPSFNVASTLDAVVRGLRRSLPLATIVAVDDGSTDETASVAARCCDGLVRLERNCGKGAALRAGFGHVLADGAEVVLTLDADGQHDPAYAPTLLAALDRADLAIGSRARSGGAMPLRRRVTNALASAAVGAIAGAPVPDAQSGFRAIRRAVLQQVHARGDRYEFETDLLIGALRAGFRLATVPIPTIYGPPSHFRAVADSVRVVRTIWRHGAGAIR
jgi:glycosyltransferase involved in cell wall biosynthesis